MSKPLELFIYPPIPRCPISSGWSYARDDWFDDRAVERKLSEKKRLTEAELAAEYWSAHAIHERAARGQSCIEYIAEAEVEVWTRFATLPHYDEVPA
ncbi:hypothetical protein AHiyo6_04060 [Arthrobacter sp. Hiyo6]|nr:hypothetical protein AHiyo6_04060 [Arthrobacter sp. Hiyo6]